MLAYYLRVFLVALFGWEVCSGIANAVLAQQPSAGTSPTATESLLEAFLQDYFQSHPDPTSRYIAAFVDLDGHGAREAIVYVLHRRYCGSGGCVTLVLARKNSSYRVVTKITITETPIRVLDSTSNGWRNLGVWVQGGGIQPGYEAELRFDGKSYPSNPSVPPARLLKKAVAGEIVIDSLKNAKPLYP